MSNAVLVEVARSVPKPLSPVPSGPWALASLAFAMLLSSLDTGIAHVALPALARAFNAPFPAVQWVVLAHLLVVTSLSVSVGRLGDATGRRRLLLAGMMLFAVAGLFSGLAPTLGLLIAARAVQGVGAAVMMALSLAMVGETVPKAEIGRAMGWLGTMSAIGTALGPSLGGFLISAFGWRALFLVTAVLGVAAFLLARRHLLVDQSARLLSPLHFDLVGTVLLAGTLTFYTLAVTLGGGRWSYLNLVLLAAAGLGLAWFVRAETRAKRPLIQLATFRDRPLRASLVMSAQVATVVTTTLVVGPFYLSRALHLEAATVGLVLSAGPLVAALTAAPAGRGVDRFGAATMTRWGLSGMIAGCLALAVLPTSFGVAGFMAPLVLLTAGYGIFQTANNTSVMAEVNAAQRGGVAGLLNLSRNLGRITGASVMGAVFAFATTATDLIAAPPDAIATGMQVTFAVAAVLMAVAISLSIGARPAGSMVKGAPVLSASFPRQLL